VCAGQHSGALLSARLRRRVLDAFLREAGLGSAMQFFLGFTWRDANPSGAASIEWYNHWVGTKDIATKDRSLAYNEDDCIATRVLLDGIRALGEN
jgi:uncharacterized protein YprB with RNaseH-like and TPR domain